jgi:hypothetical protein
MEDSTAIANFLRSAPVYKGWYAASFLWLVRPQNVAVSLFFRNQTDYFPDVPKRVVQRIASTITTFQDRTLYHVQAVLIFLDENGHLCIEVFSFLSLPDLRIR